MKIYRSLSEIDFKEKALHYASWSSGCDSTLMIMDIMEELKTNKIYEPLYTLSSNADYLGHNKREKEKKTRDSLITYLKNDLHMNFNSYELTIDMDIQPPHRGEKREILQITQPQLWLTQFLPFIPDGSVLHFGYIKGDSVWNYMHEFCTIIEQFCTMMGRDIDISFPLARYTKKDVIKSLSDKNMLDKIWYCENPYLDTNGEIIQCNRCVPCTIHDKALMDTNIEPMAGIYTWTNGTTQTAYANEYELRYLEFLDGVLKLDPVTDIIANNLSNSIVKL